MVLKSEKDIEDKFYTIALRDYKCYAAKFKIEGKNGIADRQIFKPSGKSFFIEFKKPKGGVISPHQEEFRDFMKNFNINVYFCNDLNKAIEILKEELSND